MNFFLDNCISIRYAKALRILQNGQDHNIIHLSEKFDRSSIKDVEWITALAIEGGWVIVSGDPRITRGKPERKAWHESGLTAFFLGDGWSSRNFWAQAVDIVGWWPKIVQTAKESIEGNGYLIPVKSKEFKRIYHDEKILRSTTQYIAPLR